MGKDEKQDLPRHAMPLDAAIASGEGGPPEELPPAPGTAASFRLLTARLKGFTPRAVADEVVNEETAPAVALEPDPMPAPEPVEAPVAEAEPIPPEPVVEPPAVIALPEPPAPPPATEAPPPAAVSDDPKTAVVLLPEAAPEPVVPSPAAEAAAASLLDIIWGALDLPPQERTLAGDTLLLLLPQLSERQITLVAERVSTMEQPPPLLLARLLHDPRPGVSNLLLERASTLPDQLVIQAIDHKNPDRLRLLAKRRAISTALADHLAASGDLLTMLALLRKAEIRLSFKAFLALSAAAAEHPSLQPPLALRADLPLAVGLELFWVLPPELRRVILQRFLPDSATLSRLVTIALSASEDGTAPSREQLSASPEDLDAALTALAEGRRPQAAQAFAKLAGIAEATATRILADQEGEAMVALMKALSLSRKRFEEALERMRAVPGLLKNSRPADELTAVFDSLSYNKARVMLIYWDWFTKRRGPYALQG